jgi:integrase
MSVRKINNSWWVDFRADYVRYRKRSPENSKAGAEAYEATLRKKLARGESIDRAPLPYAQTFEGFAWQWFDQYVIANNKYSEQYAKRKMLNATLIPFFGRMELSAIDTSHIERYKAKAVSTGVSNKTINNRLTVLSKCLRCASEWLGTRMPHIKFLRCPPARTDYLTVAECEALLARSSGQLGEMLLMALRTGMRQGEIRGLQWSSIDWENRHLTVRHSLYDRNKALVAPKSNRERHIPVATELYIALSKRRRASGYVFTNPDGGPFTCYRARRALAALCRQAGIRKIGWHVLRHTFATQLTLRGIPLTVVKELLGHSSITTTMRYSHVAPSALRWAIALLGQRNLESENFGQPVGNQLSGEQENLTHQR